MEPTSLFPQLQMASSIPNIDSVRYDIPDLIQEVYSAGAAKAFCEINNGPSRSGVVTKSGTDGYIKLAFAELIEHL